MKTQRWLTICLTSVLAICSQVFGGDSTGTNVPAPALPATAVVESVPVAVAPVAAQPPIDEPIEISYIEADIQNVLRTLAAKASVNLILGDEVTGKVTVNLKGVSYEDAMQLIAESKGYAYVKDKTVVKIKSRESLDVEPVELRVFTLSYAKAEDVRKTIEQVLTKQGKIQIDARSNTLVLSDTPSNLIKLAPLIESLDTETPQVMIEARFVEMTKNPTKALGVDWSGTLLNHQLSASGFRPAPGTDPTAPTAYATDPNTGANLAGFNLIKSLNGGPWSAPYALLNPGQASLVFSFLSADTDSELLANPRVVTTDNQKARIAIATEYPIPNFAFSEQTASLQINGFTYKDIGIILEVLPRINKNSLITLEVAPEASSSTENATLQSGGGSAVEIPIIDTRTATTTVLIKSGNTLAIGGLMRQDVSDTYTKVPLMGDAPLVGQFFRSKNLSKTKRDLLIFLTPTIVGPNAQTGYEKYVNGLPNEQVYTTDKWMPKDNAHHNSILAPSTSQSAGGCTNSPTPTQNFVPK